MVHRRPVRTAARASDMSMDANPGTGYAIYFNRALGSVRWYQLRAPELAGLFAT